MKNAETVVAMIVLSAVIVFGVLWIAAQCYEIAALSVRIGRQ